MSTVIGFRLSEEDAQRLDEIIACTNSTRSEYLRGVVYSIFQAKDFTTESIRKET